MRNLVNPEYHPALEARKTQLTSDLRSRYASMDRAALLALPVFQAYTAYYKRFKKSYHVLLQLESLAFKGKEIPAVAALVEAMFMAELESGLLTAGHDLDRLQPPLSLDVAAGEETYTLMNGQEQTLKPGDMFIADGAGVISSIIYGPDAHTRITPATRGAVFTVYAPPGIEAAAVEAHLRLLEGAVRLFASQAETLRLEVHTAR